MADKLCFHFVEARDVCLSRACPRCVHCLMKNYRAAEFYRQSPIERRDLKRTMEDARLTRLLYITVDIYIPFRMYNFCGRASEAEPSIVRY